MTRLFFKTIIVLCSIVFMALPVYAAPNPKTVQGRILLDVQQHGEAWYVLPTYERVFLGRPADAFRIMRELGLGIRSQELSAIPPALLPVSGTDSDSDGLADSFEEALGTDPYSADTDGDGFHDKKEIEQQYSPTGPARFVANRALINRLKGHILLQVEGAGQAWYVHPIDSKRYYLGRPDDAFRIMRELSLGITHENLLGIPERGEGAVTASLKKDSEPVRIEISGKEFSLAPYSSRIDAGKPLHITFQNSGTTAHNMYIKELGIGTPTVKPGESALLETDALDPGIYTLYCTIPGHHDQGMEAFIRAL